MWFVIIHAVLRGWAPYIRSKRQKKQRVHAKITNKQGRHEFDPVSWSVAMTQKVLVFECEDGVVRDYEVHDDHYDWVEVGGRRHIGLSG